MQAFSRTLRTILIVSTLFYTQAKAGPPTVTNVAASQRTGTKLVDIRYDVADTEGDQLKVRIEISHDGGKTFSVPANSLSGDVGGGIIPGERKLIVWNAGIDWDGEFSETMKVRVIASDGKGFPGLEWGQEIPPGGFFMGRDGGPEGVGPGRHVNIPWSYWMSKYEITVEQYNEFLNSCLASGLIKRDSDNLKAVQGAFLNIPNGTTLYQLDQDITWNLNKFVVKEGSQNLPIIVSWEGAYAFATHYGYDLPTDSEWEKAARGPDHDGLGEHWIYPWGNGISGANGSFASPQNPYSGRRTPVGLFQGQQSPGGLDMGNAYGLYDLIGNVSEWTRTEIINVENYPPIESINNAIHHTDRSVTRSIRGGTFSEGTTSERLKIYFRSSSSSYPGFRVIRRAQP